MDIIVNNYPTKVINITEDEFNDLTSELVSAKPDDVARDIKRTLDRVHMTDEYAKKTEFLIQAQKMLNTVITVYKIRQALAKSDMTPQVAVNFNEKN